MGNPNGATERRAIRPPRIDPNQFYSIPETAAALDRSRATVYNEIAVGRIHIVKDGRRTKVHGAEIIRVVAELASQAVA